MSSLYRSLVIEEYKKAVADAPVNPELKASLRTSDRVPAFIEKLFSEVARAEGIYFQRRGKPARVKNLRWLVRSMTEQFLQNIEAAAQAQYTSDLEISRQRLALDESQNPEKHLKEMGVTTDDPAEEIQG